MERDIFEGSFSVDNRQLDETFCFNLMSFLFFYIFEHGTNQRENLAAQAVGIKGKMDERPNRRYWSKQSKGTLSQTPSWVGWKVGKRWRKKMEGEKCGRLEAGFEFLHLLFPHLPHFSLFCSVRRHLFFSHFALLVSLGTSEAEKRFSNFIFCRRQTPTF